MRIALDQAIQQFDERLRQAEQFEQNGKLLEAAQCLVDLPQSEHSQLISLLKAAGDRHTELVRKRECAVAERSSILAESQRLRAAQQYVAAHAALEQIPVALRDQHVQSLLAELAAILRQIKDLHDRLRQRLKEGQLDEPISVVERILQLDPAADDVRRLHKQLCERRDERDVAVAFRLLKQARDAIGKNDYVLAESCLSRITVTAVRNLSDEPRKLFDAIEERVWIARQLRGAVYADKALLKLVKRLMKLQPQDGQLEKLHEEMAAALKTAQCGPQPVFLRRTKRRADSSSGLLLEPLSDLSKLEWDTKAPQLQSWASSTRRFLVAAGLALHGIGAGRLDFELKRKDSASWLNRLTEVRLRKPARTAWGLDFGTSGLKVIRLSRETDAIHVTSSDIIAYDSPIAGNGAPDVQPCFSAALQQFLDRHSPDSESLVVGFPGSQTLGRFFRLPRSDPKRARAALEFEVANQIPLPLDQVVYSSLMWDEPSGGHRQEWHTALVAAKKTHVGLRIQPFHESHARIASLQSDCIALLNVLAHCYQRKIDELSPDEAIAVVEVGDSATNVVALSPRRGPWFRTVYRGLRSLNALLVEALGITWQQADMMRRDWSAFRSRAAIEKALAPGFMKLKREIQNALKACTQAFRVRFQAVYVAGGGCEQFGLLKELAAEDGGPATTAANSPENATL